MLAPLCLCFASLAWGEHGRIVNLSTRAVVQTGDEVMIGGFIIQDGTRLALIQARGPELADLGVDNALADPVLTIINTTDPNNFVELAVNDNWEDTQGDEIREIWGDHLNLGAGSLSSAAVLTLGPGNYTAKVEGKDGATGVAIVEVYGIESAGDEGKIVNMSTRALVQTGEEVMIGGFIIGGGDQIGLIQARGPELVDYGITNALADPVLTITNTTDPNNPIELMVNDNWEDTQGDEIRDFFGGAPSLSPGSLSSGAILLLGPGNYTAKVEGKDGGSGIAIVEVLGREAPSPNRDALTAIYHALDGENWTVQTNWLSSAPVDEWHGVTADEDGFVTHLDLSGNQLSGRIPEEIGSLTRLRSLWLYDNQLSGGIPEELAGLAELKSLDLVKKSTDRGDTDGAEQLGQSGGSVVIGEPTDGGDSDGAGQHGQSGKALAGWKPTERQDSVAVGQPEQSGRFVAFSQRAEWLHTGAAGKSGQFGEALAGRKFIERGVTGGAGQLGKIGGSVVGA